MVPDLPVCVASIVLLCFYVSHLSSRCLSFAPCTVNPTWLYTLLHLSTENKEEPVPLPPGWKTVLLKTDRLLRVL